MTYFIALIGLIAAIEYQRRLADPAGLVRSAVKTISTAALSLTALLAGAPLGLVAALALGSVGDLALSRDGSRAFLLGLIAFALSHVVYVGLFFSLPGSASLFFLTGAAWAGAALLGALAASTTVWLIPYTGNLRIPVIVYVTIILSMGVAALHLNAAFQLCVIGAVSFLASDVILAIKRFRVAPGSSAFHRTSQWLWPLYWGGQALILFGVIKGLSLWLFAG